MQRRNLKPFNNKKSRKRSSIRRNKAFKRRLASDWKKTRDCIKDGKSAVLATQRGNSMKKVVLHDIRF